MVTILTTVYSSLDQFVQYSNGPIIRSPVPAKIDHLNTGIVRYSDPTVSNKKKQSRAIFSAHVLNMGTRLEVPWVLRLPLCSGMAAGQKLVLTD
jgi:hypothetical protein